MAETVAMSGELAGITYGQREHWVTGEPMPVHHCPGGVELFRCAGSWSMDLYDGDGALNFCPTCGKRLPVEGELPR